MLKTYTLFGKIQGERSKSFKRLISSEKINILPKMQPFLEVSRIFAEFGYFWTCVWRQFFISMWQPWLKQWR